MSKPTISSLDLRIVDRVLEMGTGYVLDFTDRTFAEFFSDYGVQIGNERFCADGTSKAKRLRCFLRSAPPLLTAQVLAALLEHRLLYKSEGLAENEVAAYRKLVQRLSGEVTHGSAPATEPSSETAESALLRRVFRPEVFEQLPLDQPMSKALVGRMEEAQRCIETKAFLAAVILCGSVLEGMCLGCGSQQPERVNRAYSAQYNKSAKQFQHWTLREWIEVFGRLGDLSPNTEKFGHALRDFRNYVHPAEQLAHHFSPDQHTARIGFQVVVAAAEDLVRAGEPGITKVSA